MCLDLELLDFVRYTIIHRFAASKRRCLVTTGSPIADVMRALTMLQHCIYDPLSLETTETYCLCIETCRSVAPGNKIHWQAQYRGYSFYTCTHEPEHAPSSSTNQSIREQYRRSQIFIFICTQDPESTVPYSTANVISKLQRPVKLQEPVQSASGYSTVLWPTD